MNPRSSSDTRTARTTAGALAVLAATGAALAISLTQLGLGHTAVVLAVMLGIGAALYAGVAWLIQARLRGQPPQLSTQLAVVIALVLAPLLVAMIILGAVMFVSAQDAALVGVILTLSGVLGILAATWVCRGLTADVAAIRDGLARVGEGDRDLELTATGTAELQQLAEDAGAMVRDLVRAETIREQAETARRELIAHASHDLRTPVTAMRLLATAVDDELVEGPLRREYVRRMLTHIEALTSLIDDLFELSRLQAGEISWSSRSVGIRGLVDETVAAMRPHAEIKGVVVETELPLRLAPVQANPEKLQRVLFNLIQNAIRHSPPASTVVVRAETLADTIELEVEDAGPGISPDDRPRVFDAFYRGGADAARATDGSGLGLAVARAIVDAHGGQIWLAAADTGTRVRFSVPLAA